MSIIKYAAVVLGAGLLLQAPVLAAEESYTCRNGENIRVIEVVYANPNSPVPCEVNYDKGAGANSLWRAQNQTGYCEEKAAAFVEKHQGWGWQCEKAQAGNDT